MQPSHRDVGRRVSVRHRLGDGRATDVVGELLALDGAGLRVRRSDGSEVAVAAGAVVAARVVPVARTGARRPGASSASVPAADEALDAAPGRGTGRDGDGSGGGALDGGAGGPLAVTVEHAARTTALGWSGRREDALGGWLLRSGSPRMKRGASALAVGDPGAPLGAALDEVARHYRGLGLEPAVQVSAPLTDVAGGSGAGAQDARQPGARRSGARRSGAEQPCPGRPGAAGPEAAEPAAAELERALAADGWVPQPWTVLAVRATPGSRAGRAADDRPGTAPGRAGGSVTVSPSPSPAWLAASDHHGSPLDRTDLPPERDGVAAGYAGACAPGTSGDDDGDGGGAGALVAVARGALAQGWLGVTCVAVDPAHRRRGLAGDLTDALVAHLGGAGGGGTGEVSGAGGAGAAGIEALYVQVVSSNATARTAWRALGFVDHSRYRFWTLPGDA